MSQIQNLSSLNKAQREAKAKDEEKVKANVEEELKSFSRIFVFQVSSQRYVNGRN